MIISATGIRIQGFWIVWEKSMKKRFLLLVPVLAFVIIGCGKAHIVTEEYDTPPGAEVKAATRSRSAEDDSFWKEAYKKYLVDIIECKVSITNFSDSCTYNENGGEAFFCLFDITGDNIPELWVTEKNPDESGDSCFEVLTFESEDKIKQVVDSQICFYNPEDKELYTHSEDEELKFTVYDNIAGRYSKKFSLIYADDLGKYSQEFGDGLAKDITIEEGESILAKFFDDRAKYSVKELTKLTPESVEEL